MYNELTKMPPVMKGAITCDVHPGFGGRVQGKDVTDGANWWWKIVGDYLQLTFILRHLISFSCPRYGVYIGQPFKLCMVAYKRL